MPDALTGYELFPWHAHPAPSSTFSNNCKKEGKLMLDPEGSKQWLHISIYTLSVDAFHHKRKLAVTLKWNVEIEIKVIYECHEPVLEPHEILFIHHQKSDQSSDMISACKDRDYSNAFQHVKEIHLRICKRYPSSSTRMTKEGKENLKRTRQTTFEGRP